MDSRWKRIWGLFLAFLVGGWATVWAQEAPRKAQAFRESLLLDLDTAAVRKVSNVENHLRAGQWREAFELLQVLSDEHGNALVPAGSPGVYVNVRRYVRMLLAGLPEEGRAAFRQQYDLSLKATFEQGRDQRDVALLRKVIQRGYICGFADEALLELGDLAWDAGDLDQARNWWLQLIPPEPPKEPGQPTTRLAYPDTDLELAPIQARLALTALWNNQLRQFDRERQLLEEMHPAVEGEIAGKKEPLTKHLEDFAKALPNWYQPLKTTGVPSFAGGLDRNGGETQTPNFDFLRWRKTDLPEVRDPSLIRSRWWPNPGEPAYFPVIHGDILLACDQHRVWAYDLLTGKPAWPGEDPLDARIYPSREPDFEHFDHIRQDPAQKLIGSPRFTMTIAAGRVYARMGTVLPPTSVPLESDRISRLVCLDLDHGQGKLSWEVPSNTIASDGGPWGFEGAPVVVDERVYVGLCRLDPQPQINVVCFDAVTGSLLWNVKLCTAQDNSNFRQISQQLLTYGGGTLFYASHMGVVAAIEPEDGLIRWVRTYERIENLEAEAQAARLARGPLPALYHAGRVHVAPIDADDLWTLDVETGTTLWKRQLRSPVQALLGIDAGPLIVSGRQLWGLDPQSGKLLWEVGSRDPDTHGFGRGMLAQGKVYWPLREEVQVIDQLTGQQLERRPLKVLHGITGGNIIQSDGCTVLATPTQMCVFHEQVIPPVKKPTPPMNRLALRELWRVARGLIEQREWTNARQLAEVVSVASRPGDEWRGRPLQTAAQCLVRQTLQEEGQAPSEIDSPESRQKLWQKAFEASPTPVEQIEVAWNAARYFSTVEDKHVEPWLNRLCGNPHWANLLTYSPQRVRAKPLCDLARREFSLTGEIAPSHADNTPLSPLIAAEPTPSTPFSPPWRRAWQRELPPGSRVWWLGTSAEAATAHFLVDLPPLACWSLAEGREIWRITLAKPIRWAGLFEKNVVITTDDEVRGMDLHSGETRWRVTLEEATSNSARVQNVLKVTAQNEPWRIEIPPPWSQSAIKYVAGPDQLLMQTGTRQISVLDPATGRGRWSYALPYGKLQQVSCLPGGHWSLSSTAPAGLWLLDQADGTSQSTAWLSQPWSRDPVSLHNGRLLAVTSEGHIQAWASPGPAYLDDSRQPLLWTWREAVSVAKGPPVLLSNGRDVVAIIDTDTLVGVDPESGNTLWRIPCGPAPLASPERSAVMDEERLYLVSGSVLRVLELKTGRLIWEKYLHPLKGGWTVQTHQDCVLAIPLAIAAGEAPAILFCEKSTGQELQTLYPKPAPGPVSMYLSSSQALLALGNHLTVWRVR